MMRAPSCQGLKGAIFRLILFLAAFPGYSAPFWHEARATSTTTTLEPVDLDVIEAVARDVQKASWSQPPAPILIVQQECAPGSPKNGMFGSVALMRNETTSHSVLHFRERNQAQFTMKQRVKRGDLTVVGQREFERLVKTDRLGQEGLGRADVLYMWLPGYDRSRSEAVIYYYQYFGDLSGWGGSLRLRREGKTWRIIERRHDWSA